MNRYWQQYFGVGLVKTAEDFGLQGQWPTNPELLDWLAVEFVESGWNIKALQKLIVMSATYRQSLEFPRSCFRLTRTTTCWLADLGSDLDAEVVRDSALSMSGLLSEQFGERALSLTSRMVSGSRGVCGQYDSVLQT